MAFSYRAVMLALCKAMLDERKQTVNFVGFIVVCLALCKFMLLQSIPPDAFSSEDFFSRNLERCGKAFGWSFPRTKVSPCFLPSQFDYIVNIQHPRSAEGEDKRTSCLRTPSLFLLCSAGKRKQS